MSQLSSRHWYFFFFFYELKPVLCADSLHFHQMSYSSPGSCPGRHPPLSHPLRRLLLTGAAYSISLVFDALDTGLDRSPGQVFVECWSVRVSLTFSPDWPEAWGRQTAAVRTPHSGGSVVTPRRGDTTTVSFLTRTLSTPSLHQFPRSPCKCPSVYGSSGSGFVETDSVSRRTILSRL